MSKPDSILDRLIALYGKPVGMAAFERLQGLMEHYRNPFSASGIENRGGLSQRDAILITYGDQVLEAGRPPLRTLAEFCKDRLSDLVSTIHILPFYPYTSDDGFSVVDYKTVNPDLGTWEDLGNLGQSYRLMFDAVINHISAQSAWFKAFLNNDLPYSQYFIEVNKDVDLSQVVRPRALPLLTEFMTLAGEKAVWTTFSADQVDINYQNPDVLLDMVDVLLFYAARGAQFIRLDAIAYLWKEVGTSCIHLPQTHRVIQLFRAILDDIAAQVILITETNVPHRDNISYFGNGENEAQLVYNFALPPLVLHSLQTGDVSILSDWARSLSLSSSRTTFFNFLASHDGIGLNPARGILGDEQINGLVEKILAHGGLISYKHNPDGSRSPYELNINYFDALNDANGLESEEIQINRFMVAQAIMLALVGVPGIYFHSLFGSRGWQEGVTLHGHNRAINRQKLERGGLERSLNDSDSRPYRIFHRFSQLLQARSRCSAFHPNGGQRVLNYGEGIFALLRSSIDHKEHVLCLHNVTDLPQDGIIEQEKLPLGTGQKLVDITTGLELTYTGTTPSQSRNTRNTIRLSPYQVMWLEGQ